MDKQFHWFGALFLITGLLLTQFVPAKASQRQHPVAQDAPPPVASGSPTQPVDVVVVLDDSGSMATCWPWARDSDTPPMPPCGGAVSYNPPSDPGALRYSAARLFVQLADDADRIAVVRFDSAAEGVGLLGAPQAVGGADNRRLLTDSLQPPTEYGRRGYTRIDLGLETAANLLQSVREPGRDQYILLLTDGEPTQPREAGDQRERLSAQINILNEVGIFVFPIVLCNPSAGCSGEVLREQFAEYGVREAGTAPDLLRVFSEIFAEIKADRSVITGREAGGALQLTTRDAHGVRQIALVTPKGGLLGVRHDSEAVLPYTNLNDPNIDVNLIEGEALTAGKWLVDTTDRSGFAVVQTDSYPELLNPPPSLANTPAAVRYYPAGKPLLLMARSNGPGAAEPLFYNSKTPLQPFGQDNTRVLLLKDEKPTEIRLQVGEDQAALQLVRSFRLQARADLPQAAIFSPTTRDPGLLDNGRARLQVGFGGGATVTSLAATVYVTDESGDEEGQGQLIYQAGMLCDERVCTDQSFTPADGRSYEVTYLISGEKDGIRFGDWGQTALSLKPAIALVGLPDQLDLTQMPPDGWPVQLSAGTTDEIGSLNAVLTLTRVDTGETVEEVSLNFDQEVPETGVVSTTLRVDGLDRVRPGDYVGEVTLQATTPGGKPMDVQLRPTSVFPVTFRVGRPVARIDSQLADFGNILFDTSPNFRLDQAVQLPVAFEGKPFKITATLQDSTCADLSMLTGELLPADNGSFLPLQLNSRGPVAPSTCTGSIVLAGPTDDYDVFPSRLDWQVRVDNVEWSLVSSSLSLGDLQDAGQKVNATVAVRFSGKPPFVLQLLDLHAVGRNAEGEVTLSPDQIEMSPVEVNGPPTEAGLYEVPVTLVARQAIVRDQLRGSFYTGEMTLGVVGLEGATQTLDFDLRSPSIPQRYILPYVVPVYSMPLALCTGPLTLFLLLFMVARWRGRSLQEDEIEEAAIAAVSQAPVAPVREASNPPALPTFTDAPASETGWSNGEWGSAWGNQAETSKPVVSKPPSNGANGVNGGDPWKSSW